MAADITLDGVTEMPGAAGIKGSAKTRMTVTVLYFAALRERIGCESQVLDIPPEGLAVSDLLARLGTADARTATALADEPRLRVAVNHTLCAMHDLVRPGDEVAVFPPMTGG